MRDLAQQIVGSSPAITALRDYLPKVACSQATVLITGDTGTGKERVARALHDISPRQRRPFVAINCAALPDGLVESELFGHERGAFTGATGAVKGHFAEADGGTLFLDEVGELSLSAQAKLLRVIETREIMPVGARRSVPINVRIVAATNRSLESLVSSHQFRADLYYRLHVAHLDLPSLKERREDIPLLFCDAVEEFNQRYECLVGAPDSQFLQCLMAHDWPGNIRELRNLVEAIFIDPPPGVIKLKDLPPVFRSMFARYQSTASSERDQILDILQKTRWNKVKAAKALNWSRMTLYRKIAKNNIIRSALLPGVAIAVCRGATIFGEAAAVSSRYLM